MIMAIGEWNLDPFCATSTDTASVSVLLGPGDESDVLGLRGNDHAAENGIPGWDDAWIDLGGEA